MDWLWGFVTVGINAGKVKVALGSMPMPANPWDLIFKPEYATKLKGCGVNLLDSASEVLPVAMIYAGKPPYSRNAKDYDAAREVLTKARPYVTRFVPGYINELAGRRAVRRDGLFGRYQHRAPARDRHQDLGRTSRRSSRPAARRCSSTRWRSHDANPKNAHLFINYILRPRSTRR